MGRPRRFPVYPARAHRSRQARITIPGAEPPDVYLGVWGSPESREKYNRLASEWYARGGKPPPPKSGLTLAGLIDLYLAHAATRYVKRGQPTGTVATIAVACAGARRLYGSLPAAEFGPVPFKAVRHAWAAEGKAVSTINGMARKLVQMARWGVEEELLPADAWHRLRAVRQLVPGRDVGRVRPPIPPVADDVLERVIAAAHPMLGAMMRVQRLSGMRPIEVCWLAPKHVDRSGPVWWYAVPPEANKEDHKGRERRVPLGPRAQAVLAPYLERAKKRPGDALFRPCDAPCSRSRARRYAPGNYGRCLRSACLKAGVPPFGPNRLRKAAATEINRRYDLQAARTVLGHSEATTTAASYVSRDYEAAAKIAAEMG